MGVRLPTKLTPAVPRDRRPFVIPKLNEVLPDIRAPVGSRPAPIVKLPVPVLSRLPVVRLSLNSPWEFLTVKVPPVNTNSPEVTSDKVPVRMVMVPKVPVIERVRMLPFAMLPFIAPLVKGPVEMLVSLNSEMLCA